MSAVHIAQPQSQLVSEIAGIIREYRKRPTAFTKFELMGGLSFGPEPVAATIRVTPSKKEETFRCRDQSLLGKAGSDRDAFFDAVETFAERPVILAWNGKTPNASFHVVRDMSANLAYPTFSVELAYRRKGEPDELRTNMFFIAFDDVSAANAYAEGKAGLLI